MLERKSVCRDDKKWQMSAGSFPSSQKASLEKSPAAVLANGPPNWDWAVKGLVR